MLKKTVIALLAAASISAFAPTMAQARGGFGGGGFHGGGFGGFHGGGFGGFHGGGFRGGAFAGGFRGFHGFHGRGFRNRFAFFGPGVGFYDPYDYDDYAWDYPGYGDYGYYGYPYGYAAYAQGGGCYTVHRRVHTSHGWRRRLVEVCR